MPTRRISRFNLADVGRGVARLARPVVGSRRWRLNRREVFESLVCANSSALLVAWLARIVGGPDHAGSIHSAEWGMVVWWSVLALCLGWRLRQGDHAATGWPDAEADRWAFLSTLAIAGSIGANLSWLWRIFGGPDHAASMHAAACGLCAWFGVFILVNLYRLGRTAH